LTSWGRPKGAARATFSQYGSALSLPHSRRPVARGREKNGFDADAAADGPALGPGRGRESDGRESPATLATAPFEDGAAGSGAHPLAEPAHAHALDVAVADLYLHRSVSRQDVQSVRVTATRNPACPRRYARPARYFSKMSSRFASQRQETPHVHADTRDQHDILAKSPPPSQAPNQAIWNLTGGGIITRDCAAARAIAWIAEDCYRGRDYAGPARRPATRASTQEEAGIGE